MFKHVRPISKRDFRQELPWFGPAWTITEHTDPVLGYYLKYRHFSSVCWCAVEMQAITDEVNDKVDPSDWGAELISQSTFYRRRRKALTMASSPDGSFSHDEIEKAMRIMEGLNG